MGKLGIVFLTNFKDSRKLSRLYVNENINNNELLPGRYTDLTLLKHTVLQIYAPNHESLDFFEGFHL